MTLTLKPRTMQRTVAPDAISVYLVERLGNQLFTYAAALAQARRLGVACHANLGYFRHQRPKRPHEYGFSLDAFDHGLVISDDPRRHFPVVLGLPGVSSAIAWHQRIGPLGPARMFGPPVFMESSFRYDPRIETVTPGTTLLGFFQSWKYSAAIGDELRERMTRLSNPSPWFQAMSRRIVPGEEAIALNVRRGDYVTHQQSVQGLATRDFYETALKTLRRMGLTGPVFVASDSLGDVMEELEGLDELIPIDPPPGTDPMEALVLLSRVDGLVAANSTFSWWAGFLGARSDQVVIAPRPWFTRETINTRDLLMPEWLTLDRERVWTPPAGTLSQTGVTADSGVPA